MKLFKALRKPALNRWWSFLIKRQHFWHFSCLFSCRKGMENQRRYLPQFGIQILARKLCIYNLSDDLPLSRCCRSSSQCSRAPWCCCPVTQNLRRFLLSYIPAYTQDEGLAGRIFCEARTGGFYNHS